MSRQHYIYHYLPALRVVGEVKINMLLVK